MLGTPEAVRQCVEGEDFIRLGVMIADLSPSQATTLVEGWPYSIAGLCGHMLFWQKRWLGIIDGIAVEKKVGKNRDWPEVMADAWDDARRELLEGEARALDMSRDLALLERRTKTGKTAERFLLQIGIHNTYHVGQIALLRQLMGLWRPDGTGDFW